jgi:hypothetical protein
VSGIQVVPVADRVGIAAFLAAARRAQSVNPNWVEPVHDEIRALFNPRRTPFMRENAIQPFVAFRDGQPIGRIVATVDRAHLAKHKDDCGFFGFIDAIDDRDVFAALFAEAEKLLRAQGMRAIRGPFSLTINHESGLLVDGFDKPHVIHTNHAPPHYARHIEALGYAKAMDLVAYVCRPREAHILKRREHFAGLSGDPTIKNIEIHTLSLRSWRRDFPRLLAIFNDAWSDNAWATPVSDDEARFIARSILPVSKPKWMHIARYNGEDVAIAVQIPDVNEALRGLNGKLLPFGAAKLLWRVHAQGTRRTRVPMFGVAKKWRGTKAAQLATSTLFARILDDAYAADVEEIEYSWMLETNKFALNGLRRTGARLTRTFRVYERALSLG